MASPPWRARIGAGQQHRVERGGVGRRPGERPDDEKRRDDWLQPERAGPGGGFVRAGLRAQDQNLHRAEHRAEGRAARASSARAKAAGSRLASLDLAAVGQQDFGVEHLAVDRKRRDRRMAIAAQGGEERALGIHSFMGRRHDRWRRARRADRRAPPVSRRRSRLAPGPAADRAGRRRRDRAGRARPLRARSHRTRRARSSQGASGRCPGSARPRDRAAGPAIARRGAARRCRPGRPRGKAARLSAPISRSPVSARSSIAAIDERFRTDRLDILHRMDARDRSVPRASAGRAPWSRAPCRPVRPAAGPGSCRPKS